MQVLRRWRVWAPLKHAQRRRLRDAVTALHSSKRRRVWGCLRDYTATRRLKGAARRRAQQHFRWGHAWQQSMSCASLRCHYGHFAPGPTNMVGVVFDAYMAGPHHRCL